MRLITLVVASVSFSLVMGRPVLGDAAKESDATAKAREWVLKLRTSKDAGERRSVTRELGKIGLPAVAPLGELLRDQDSKLREAAAWAFGGMERPVVTKALPVLFKAMRHESDESVLEALAKVIAHAEEAAVPGLTDLVRTTTGEVRSMGFYSLGRLHGAAKAAVPALIELLKHKDEAARGGATYVLGRIGPAARPAVPALLKLPDTSPRARSAVIDALASIRETPDEVLRLVLRALKDPEARVRYSAVGACEAFGPKAKAAVPDLIRLLDDDKVNSRDQYPRQVVRALGRVGPAARAAGPKLVPLLNDPDIEHASHAAAALLSIGIEEKAAVAVFGRALDKGLQRDKAYVRFRTFDVLERMGPAAKPLVPLLLSIAKDVNDDREIRFQAARVLRQLDPKAAEKLK